MRATCSCSRPRTVPRHCPHTRPHVSTHCRYAPWNAQATLFRRTAFWGLLLPVTVPGRVTDIWRSYIVQRLLWEMGGTYSFVAPFVTQYRNPHSYQKDFDDELDVYTKVSTVIETLSSFTNQRSEALPALYRRVMDVLVDKKILKHGDAKRACAWFSIP